MTRDQRGAATAELAMGIPLLVSLTVGLVWLLALGVTEVRVVDAARETARAGARGEEPAAAVARGERVAPGARVSLTRSGGDVWVTATERVGPPGGVLGFLPGVQVHAEAVAAAEAGS